MLKKGFGILLISALIGLANGLILNREVKYEAVQILKKGTDLNKDFKNDQQDSNKI